MEFLYDAGLQVGNTSSTDEYLLGKPVEVAAEENQISKVLDSYCYSHLLVFGPDHYLRHRLF